MLRSTSRETKTANSVTKRVPAERESEFHPFHATNGHGAVGGVNALHFYTPHPLAAMQRAFGNQAVLRSLSPRRPTIQTKLTINTPGDHYEQEADRVAEQVMRMPDPSAASSAMASAAPVLQRKCACGGSGEGSGTCSECAKKEELQRSAVGPVAVPEAPPIVHDVLGQPGRPLDASTRVFFEPRFGHDFSQVRIHGDARASRSAAAVNALAYTVGNHIVLGEVQTTPRSGRGLLAHELTHVVQQRTGTLARQTPPSPEASGSCGELCNPGPDCYECCDFFCTGWLDKKLCKAACDPYRLRQECVPGPGIPNSTCGAYVTNLWWLPLAYVQNATCACRETPNDPTAMCVRRILQDQMASAPSLLKATAAAAKGLPFAEYEAFVQTVLTPLIYQNHVDAYRSCCCPGGPAPYPAWIGVTTVPLPCSKVGDAIRKYGSCHGTPGAW